MCIVTGDYAMQNVALQMGLRLVAPDGKRIWQTRRWALRCSACFQICKVRPLISAPADLCSRLTQASHEHLEKKFFGLLPYLKVRSQVPAAVLLKLVISRWVCVQMHLADLHSIHITASCEHVARPAAKPARQPYQIPKLSKTLLFGHSICTRVSHQ